MNTDQTIPEILLPCSRVRASLGGICRSTFYRLRKEDETFPQAVPISRRRIGFRERELAAWIEAQAAKVQG